MYVIREVVHCKPGKVRPMLEKFKTISKVMEGMGLEPLRLLTDAAGEKFWTIVAEGEAGSLTEFLALEEELMGNEEIRNTMADYHDLIVEGRREVYKLEA